MSPEYSTRGIITKKLDIFSLGVIIIEITTGDKHYPDNVEEFIEPVSKLCFNFQGDAPLFKDTLLIFPLHTPSKNKKSLWKIFPRMFLTF